MGSGTGWRTLAAQSDSPSARDGWGLMPRNKNGLKPIRLEKHKLNTPLPPPFALGTTKRNPTGRRILRDGWLAPLTLSDGKGADESEAHQGGVRASDKGFLGLEWHQYLVLLRWTAEQRCQGRATAVPEKLRGILGALGIEASMWRDLVWEYRRYFGRSTCTGSPQAMAADARRSGRHHHSGQRLVRECFAGSAAGIT
jgi:hypothetical protein